MKYEIIETEILSEVKKQIKETHLPRRVETAILGIIAVHCDCTLGT